MFNIRASSLPYYTDCPRKWAANSIPRDIIEGLGIKLRTQVPYVYAKMGTGTHSGVALSLRRKKDGIMLPNPLDDIYQAGIEKFREEIHEGVIWDSVTNNINTAEKQIQNVLRAYYNVVLPQIEPLGIEYALKAKIDDDYMLTGHMDVNCENEIRDFKNGVRDPKAFAQMGGYAILKKANKEGQAKKLIIDHIKRTSLKKPQAMPEVVEYDVIESEREAKAIYKRIIRDMNDFLNSGDPGIFMANLHSNLCSAKYCRAYKTKWCKLTK